MNKILIVEDESVVALDIASALRKEGYEIADIAEDCGSTFRAIERTHPDLIIMDVHINGAFDGIETSRRIQKVYGIPLIFLTAYNDRKTIDRAIQTAPKGYLIKPFKRRELYAAVSLALSDGHKEEKTIPLCDGCTYYPERAKLERNGEMITLSKKESTLLKLLLTHTNSVVSFEAIEYEVWPDKEVSTTTRRTLIHRLREKVGGAIIETMKEVGCILKSDTTFGTLPER